MATTAALPLTALVGLDLARQALLLLAVDPHLRGVVVAAPVGTGKSTLARGFPALLPSQSTSLPYVEIPLGADDEALLGGLDLEATLRTGRRVARPGALARADRGVVYVDQLNLLSDSAANLLLTSLENGAVRVEREGLSLSAAAHFMLLASYDPAEGQPRRHLLDRVGLLVTLPHHSNLADRMAVVRRNRMVHPDDDDELAMLQALVAAARELLPEVLIAPAQAEQLLTAALAFGVEGHRADLFAVRTACAAAALALRTQVEPEDLELAMRLVILPRATQQPAPPEPPPEQSPPEPPPQSNEQPPPEQADEQQPDASTLPDEQVFAALAAELPTELSELPFRSVRRGRSGSRGSTGGNRGRHIRSTPGDPRRRRIDIAATLRSAAPWQRLRNSTPTSRVVLRADDLRVKHFKSKAGALFCFAVDASGSMALHRMRQAKGAVHTLLQKAYVHRDRVALLAFRGERADLLLPPSQSVELARRALDLLPTGGGTPLAAALLAALDVAAQAKSRGILQTVLVLLTDGRANIPLRGDRAALEGELQALGRSIAEAGIQSIVVDTQRNYLSRGEARRLAGWLQGQYIYLPNAKGEEIAAAALEHVH
jgi:magnesium chelatase subunit D